MARGARPVKAAVSVVQALRSNKRALFRLPTLKPAPPQSIARVSALRQQT